ncbi:hypothetical protein cand_019410 [Cryptosporidium andersoni]|uniref:Uncharacterized protein n=1 Tax=Cryptosporidium andersoni TaxID=117008 RepID=A0A1J4MT38_9CRYT|nr:hypothetical protein cand_019410 [Cryptosporidium andersoni]
MVSNDINEEFPILQNINPENQGFLLKYTDNMLTAISINKTIMDIDGACEYTITFLLSIFVPTYIFSLGYISAANIEVKAFKK